MFQWIEELRRQVAQWSSDIQEATSGMRREGSIRDGRWVDETDEYVADRRGRSGTLSEIIAALEKRNG